LLLIFDQGRTLRVRRVFALMSVAAALVFGSSPAAANPLLLLDTMVSTNLLLLIPTGSLCVTYDYDANGNRISQSSFTFGTAGAVWGSGVYGCFNYTS